MTRKVAIEVLEKLKKKILIQENFDENLTILEVDMIAEAIDFAIIDVKIAEAFSNIFIKP